MTSRILFLCARGSSRSLIAASLLAARAGNQWEIWSTPTQDEVEQVAAYRRIRDALSQEIKMHLLLPSMLTVLPQRK